MSLSRTHQFHMFLKITLILSAIIFSVASISDATLPELSPELEKEINCMAIAIHHEANNQPKSGKVAVANVILNRTKNPKFPSDVCSVITQKTKGSCQFSFVCNKNWMKVRPSEEIQQIAFDTVVNRPNDNTNGSLFFHHIGLPEWVGLRKTKVIGSHIFYTYQKRTVNDKRKNEST